MHYFDSSKQTNTMRHTRYAVNGDPRFEPDMPTATEAGFTMELDINQTPIPADVTFCYIEVDGKAVVEVSEIDIDCYVSSDMTKWLPQVQDEIDNYLYPMEVIFK